MAEKKKTITKAGVGGVGALLIALSVIIGSLGGKATVVGEYEISPTTEYTVRVVATDIEEVAEATFYDVVFTGSDGNEYNLGTSNYGEPDGVITSNIVTTPIENLSVVVYDSDLEVIGVGKFKNGGTIEYEIKKELVSSEKADD